MGIGSTFLGVEAVDMNLTTHLQLVARLRKHGFIHPPPHTPSWHSALLVKHMDNFTLYVLEEKAGNMNCRTEQLQEL
jgi:hypothetical protein